jgi:hypothetical protein
MGKNNEMSDVLSRDTHLAFADFDLLNYFIPEASRYHQTLPFLV